MKKFFKETEVKEIITSALTIAALIIAIISNIIVFFPKTDSSKNKIEVFENTCSQRLEQAIKYLEETEKYEEYKDILKIMSKNKFISELKSDTELNSEIKNKESYVEHMIERTFKNLVSIENKHEGLVSIEDRTPVLVSIEDR